MQHHGGDFFWRTKAVQRNLRLDAGIHGLHLIRGQAKLGIEGRC